VLAFLYFVITVLFILIWFPLLRELVGKHYKSLYVTMNYLQFLGVYSEVDVPWNNSTSLQSVLSATHTTNLNLDLTGEVGLISCIGYSFEVKWAIQAGLPLLYPCICLLDFGLARLLKFIAAKGWPPSRTLLRLGWRPRRAFNWDAIVHAYGPPGLFFLNMYLNKGMLNALEPLRCSNLVSSNEAPPYLVAYPDIPCWEGERHIRLVVVGCIALLLYGGVMGIGYPWLLFRLLPRVGLYNPKYVELVGFAYARFEDDCYWWELNYITRKVAVNVILRFVPTALSRTICTMVICLFVGVADLVRSPFKLRLYDVQANICAVDEIVVLLVGLLVLYREGTTDADSISEESWLDSVESWAITALCVATGACTYGVMHDVIAENKKKRLMRLRKQGGVTMSTEVFEATHGLALLPKWLTTGAEDEQVNRFKLLRKTEKLLAETFLGHRRRQIDHDEGSAGRAELYKAQAKGDPFLLDFLLQDLDGKGRGKQLAAAVTWEQQELAREERSGASPAASLFAPKLRGEVAQWMAENAKPDDLAAIHEFVRSVQQFESELAAQHEAKPTGMAKLCATITRPHHSKEACKAKAVAKARKAAALRWQKMQAMGSLKLTKKAELAASRNSTEQLLLGLLSQLHAERALLIPVPTSMSKRVAGFPVVQASSVDMDVALEDVSFDESIESGNAASVVLSGRTYLVDNVFDVDDEAGHTPLREVCRGRPATKFDQISKLCVPIFAVDRSGSPRNDVAAVDSIAAKEAEGANDGTGESHRDTACRSSVMHGDSHPGQGLSHKAHVIFDGVGSVFRSGRGTHGPSTARDSSHVGYNQSVIGILKVFNKVSFGNGAVGVPFTPEDIEVAQGYARLVSVAARSVETEDKMLRMATSAFCFAKKTSTEEAPPCPEPNGAGGAMPPAPPKLEKAKTMSFFGKKKPPVVGEQQPGAEAPGAEASPAAAPKSKSAFSLFKKRDSAATRTAGSTAESSPGMAGSLGATPQQAASSVVVAEVPDALDA